MVTEKLRRFNPRNQEKIRQALKLNGEPLEISDIEYTSINNEIEEMVNKKRLE
jgi:hypothetical protein